VNSEELEQSLRSEFETYLSTVLADLKQGSAEFQTKIQAEFDRHRAQFDEAFAELSAKFDANPGVNDAFHSSVAEHLKLARDEGAKIAANAMVEAEKFEERMPAAEAPPARYDAIRDAVNDISSKDSQSAILKTLVQHAGEFAPRGAFFIIKSGHFAGWKVFGTADDMEQTIREVHFPISNDTILSSAVNSLSTVGGSAGDHTNNSSFLDPLSFGNPQQMMAFPLIARGRGVAVLYVDSGDGQGDINRDALETIIKVAGLTVELLASTQTAAEENRAMGPADFENARHEQEDFAGGGDTYGGAYPMPVQEVPPARSSGGFSFTENVPSSAEYQAEPLVEPAPEYGTSYQDSSKSAYSQPESYFEPATPSVEAELPNTARSFDPTAASSSFDRPSFGSESNQETGPAYDYSFDRSSEVDQPSGGFSADSSSPAGSNQSSTEFSQPAHEFGTPTPNFGGSTSDFGQPTPRSADSTPQFGRSAPDFGQSTSQPSSSAQQFGQQAPEFGQSEQPFGQSTSEFNQPASGFGQAAPEFGRSAPDLSQTTEEYNRPSSGYGQPIEARSSSPFDADPSVGSPSSPFDKAVEEYRPSGSGSAVAYTPAPEPVVPAPAVSAPQGRLSDRPVDLPIEVPDEERRLHNDARRFARLLVSEIKLYNEKKVIEGKQSHDLYDRLKEAIDRSREMYDKRVQPPVASKFDYFHYELLNSLAEGNIERLGPSYPGAKV
jgi:hypothetical protein